MHHADLLTLPRRRAGSDGRRGHVVDYRHVLHALRAKPGALIGLSYRDALWPRPAFARAWDTLIVRRPERKACRTTVGLLVLAHEGACDRARRRARQPCSTPGGCPTSASCATLRPACQRGPPVARRRRRAAYDSLRRSSASEPHPRSPETQRFGFSVGERLERQLLKMVVALRICLVETTWACHRLAWSAKPAGRRVWPSHQPHRLPVPSPQPQRRRARNLPWREPLHGACGPPGSF